MDHHQVDLEEPLADQDFDPHVERKKGSDAEDEPNQHKYNVVRDKQKRQSKPPMRYGFPNLVSYAFTSASDVVEEEPLTYEEAIASRIQESRLRL